MTEPAISTRAKTRRPMICEDEVQFLAASYGVPIRCTFSIQADEYIRAYRWRKDIDRRAEVIFAIQDAEERIWLHAKRHYPSHIFRLPSGGINWNEPVVDALYREVAEETSLDVTVERFIGVIQYHFIAGERVATFASYIFHLKCDGGHPVSDPSEEISEFRPVLSSQIAQTAADLRNLIGDRKGWGQWRALAHDLVYEHLSG